MIVPLRAASANVEPITFPYGLLIDWTQSDKRLIARFALWLRRNAPTSRVVKEARGRTSSRDLLKELAALRLSREVKILAAMRYAEDKLGEPLYADEQTWSKQRNKAADFLLELFVL